MKKEYLEAWVAALRSGEYKQGLGTLRYNNLYCCLGVLGDLVVKNNWFPELEVKWEKDYLVVGDYEGYNVIPSKLAEELHLSDDEQYQAFNLNDSKRLSFVEIAYYIKDNFRSEP